LAAAAAAGGAKGLKSVAMWYISAAYATYGGTPLGGAGREES